MNAVSRYTLPFCLLALLRGAVGYSQNVDVNWYSFNGGFAVPSGPNTVVKSSTGQMAVGSPHQANSFLESGFLANPMLRGVLVNVGENKELPLSYSLSQNYPNPFNPSTVVSYQLPAASDVKLVVYDLLGREVSVLVNGRKEAGVHEVKFDAGGLASGMYVYRLRAGDYVGVKKLMVLK
jgi:hypothetical protein